MILFDATTFVNSARTFGLGILPADVKPCPFAAADEAVREGRAEYRPLTNGRGLTAREHLVMLAARNEAFYQAERSAKGDDFARAAAVGRACQIASERTLREILANRRRAIAPVNRERFEPTWEDNRAAAQMFADEETDRLNEAMEAACLEAEWSDRLSGIILEDEMLSIGACG